MFCWDEILWKWCLYIEKLYKLCISLWSEIRVIRVPTKSANIEPPTEATLYDSL